MLGVCFGLRGLAWLVACSADSKGWFRPSVPWVATRSVLGWLVDCTFDPEGLFGPRVFGRLVGRTADPKGFCRSAKSAAMGQIIGKIY